MCHKITNPNTKRPILPIVPGFHFSESVHNIHDLSILSAILSKPFKKNFLQHQIELHPLSLIIIAVISRSQGNLGSTKNDPLWVDLNNYNGPPWLTQDPDNNPLMKNWNHIYIRYCDGGFYAGNKSIPDTYNNTKIYYRGAIITQEIITTLQNEYGMNKATDIVISGCSAGILLCI